MNIGSTIYKLRTAKNLSQEELAERLNVSRQSVSKWETDASVPDLDKLMKLSDIFEVSLDELVGKESPKSRAEESPPMQVIVQQVPAKDSFFTVNKIMGSILLLASMLSTMLSGNRLRDFVFVGFQLYLVGIYNLTELRERWLWYSYWVYVEKLLEIRILIGLWSKIQSPMWKTVLMVSSFVIFAVTSIVWVRFFRKRVPYATVAEKYNRAILVVLGWLAHLSCIVLYILSVAKVIRLGSQYVWLLLSLSTCVGMVGYTTAYLVHRKNKQS